ncbi:hypothetical protein [Flavobacterium sp.]
MKKFIFIVLVFASCKNYNRDCFSYDESIKESWINSYKYEVCYGCLKEGIGNDSLRIILKKKDLFNKNLEIDFSTIDNARSIGKNIIINMPKPFIKIDEEQNDLKEKNFISYNCLKYYASKELDSIAKFEYEKYLKNKL